MQKGRIALTSLGIAIAASVIIAGSSLASSSTSRKFGQIYTAIGSVAQRPAIIGTVVAINGTNITVNGKDNIVYNVDASKAKIAQGAGQNAQALSLSDIKVNDIVGIIGTISGTSVSATTVFEKAELTSIQRPAVSGTVASVNGTIITVNAKNNGYYAVDASNAKLAQGFGQSSKTITISDIKVGDSILAFGTVSGTSVSATSVIDGLKSCGSAKQGPKFNGQVTAVNGSSFTLQATGRGKNASTTASYTVNTSSSTVFKKDRQNASLGDLASGAKVRVSGTLDSSSNIINASRVSISTKSLSVKNVHFALGRFGRR